MRSPALSVDRSQAEHVRRWLLQAGCLRHDLMVLRQGDRVLFPLLSAPPPLPEGLRGTPVDAEFPPPVERSPRDYRELLSALPPEVRPLLPSSFDVIGEVVLIRLPDEVLPYRLEVGKALLSFVPGCRKVGLDQGVHGETRLRSLEPLAGSGPWATVHRENGIRFYVDVELAYFSPRLAREHARVAELCGERERVLDLCCGIGPFVLTILHRHLGSSAVAVDLNPDAVRLLRENALRLRVADRLEVREASAEAFLEGTERFSRVVMNLPREGNKYAPSVASHVMVGGTLHHYEVVPREDLPGRAGRLASELHAAGAGRWSVAPSRLVHPYSPRADLVAFTSVREA